MEVFDVIVIGGGPAGLAAALAANEVGAKTIIIEREKYPGGILKQCIHDGFGLIRFKERLSGPEYAERYIKMVKEAGISLMTSTFVTHVEEQDGLFKTTLVNAEKGVFTLLGKALVLACGCRERTAKQVFISGTRPAGIFSAGTAQYIVNIDGYLPCRKCVILGSGDIGLIMARRLTLEGAEVVGVYEAKPTPSGLTRNVVQCLEDFNIPLYLSHTITKVFGEDRVSGVEIVEVDENMKPLPGTEQQVICDGVILSVGLIPENEIAEMLGVTIDKSTKGPLVDDHFMTLKEGIFSCGNALHVNDLVDYVSESGSYAGRYAAQYAKKHVIRKLIPIKANHEDFLYVVPQYIDKASANPECVLYFRSKEIRKNVRIQLKMGDKILYDNKFNIIKPPEMERIQLDISKIPMACIDDMTLLML